MKVHYSIPCALLLVCGMSVTCVYAATRMVAQAQVTVESVFNEYMQALTVRLNLIDVQTPEDQLPVVGFPADQFGRFTVEQLSDFSCLVDRSLVDPVAIKDWPAVQVAAATQALGALKHHIAVMDEMGDVFSAYVRGLECRLNQVKSKEGQQPRLVFPSDELSRFTFDELHSFSTGVEKFLDDPVRTQGLTRNYIAAVERALDELKVFLAAMHKLADMHKQATVSAPVSRAARVREVVAGAGAFVAGKAKNAGGTVLHLPADFGALSGKNKAGVVAVALTGTAGLAALIMNRQPVAAAVRTAGSGVASAVRTAGTGVAGFARRMFGAGKQQQSEEQSSSAQSVAAADAQNQA